MPSINQQSQNNAESCIYLFHLPGRTKLDRQKWIYVFLNYQKYKRLV